MHLALFVPSRPPASPLISYGAAIAPLLLRDHRLTLIFEAPESAEAKQVRALFPGRAVVQSYAAYEEEGAPCDLALYPYGDRDRLNGFVHEAARRRPGIAILHDAVLHQALLHDVALRRDAAYCRRELTAVYGDLGEGLAARVLGGQAREVLRHYSALPTVLGSSLALVTPSQTVADELATRSVGPEVRYIPPPAPSFPVHPRSRADMGLRETPLIVVPAPPETEGDIVLLRTALCALQRAFPTVRVLICDQGRLSTNPAWREVSPAERLWKLDYLSPERRDALVAGADAAILFASPEGTLDPTLVVRLLVLGTPVVAVDPLNLQCSLRCAVAPVWREEPQPWAALRAALHYLLSDRQAAQEAAMAGQRLAMREHHPETVRRAWAQVLQEAAARRPHFRAARLDDLSGRAALSSLTGRALAELGVTLRDRALLPPLAAAIADLTPNQMPELPCLDA